MGADEEVDLPGVEAEGDAVTDDGLDALLEYLHRSRGFDFTTYKRSTLTRRMKHRMQMIGVPDFEDYQDFLEVHPDEFAQLFNTILINVTSFFRDLASWEFINTRVIPAIIGAKESTGAIRCWVAGCASGEEAYTLAMCLHQALGPADYASRVKIYGQDLRH
jgi:two-component system, chemotaxis family, CheB/CheR fusion protein